MKRILYDVPRWNIYLHRKERKLPRVQKSDNVLLCFQDELFDRLFAGDSDKLTPKQINKQLKQSAPWAENTHEYCTQLGLDEIAKQVKGKAQEAALATEWAMQTIMPNISKPQQQSQSQKGQAQEVAQGLEDVSLDGSTGENEAHQRYAVPEEKRIEEVAEILKDDERLKKIALLAGRFKNIVLTKQKTKVKHESDELADIEQGGEISRLLPSELVKFLSPKLKAVVMRDVVERKALQYSMTATETLGRGPLILCVDKSGSMEGDKDVWSTAIALALLDMAHRNKRVFILLGFDDEVFQKVVVLVGNAIPKEHLCVAPRGGTNIYEVLDLALNAVETRARMHRADIILITDGESDTSRADEIKERAKQRDVSILGIGIGSTPDNVLPWCDEAHSVTDMGGIDDESASALFGK